MNKSVYMPLQPGHFMESTICSRLLEKESNIYTNCFYTLLYLSFHKSEDSKQREAGIKGIYARTVSKLYQVKFLMQIAVLDINTAFIHAP